MVKKLFEVLPNEFMGGEYEGTPAHKLRNTEVKYCFDGTVLPWPGRHKNVYFWCLLIGNKLVGFNENPSHGWSFPVMNNPGTSMTQITQEITNRLRQVSISNPESNWLYPGVAILDVNSYIIWYRGNSHRIDISYDILKRYLGWLRSGNVGTHMEMPEDYNADLTKC